VQSPVFFGGADVEIHSPLVQFWSLKVVKSEEVGIEIAEVLRRHLSSSQSMAESISTNLRADLLFHVYRDYIPTSTLLIPIYTMDLYMPCIEHTEPVLKCLFQQSVRVLHEDLIQQKAERLQI
jgi:hypothetical protein